MAHGRSLNPPMQPGDLLIVVHPNDSSLDYLLNEWNGDNAVRRREVWVCQSQSSGGGFGGYGQPSAGETVDIVAVPYVFRVVSVDAQDAIDDLEQQRCPIDGTKTKARSRKRPSCG